MAEIPITGIPSTFRVPGQFVEILFAQGPSTASAGVREVVFVMPKLAAGTYADNTIVRVRNEAEVEAGAGAGSPLHRSMRLFLQANKNATIWALPYPITSGGVPVAADLDVTWTNDPSGTGVTTLYVAGELTSIGFDDTDTATTIAANMAAAINAKTFLPVTATSVAGVLTLVAKVAGISQGDGTTAAIAVHVEIDAGLTTTVATQNGGTLDGLGLGAAAAGVDGSTTEAANLATALATIDAARYYYMCVSTWDATSLTNLNTHLANKSEPNPGLRSVGMFGYRGTLGTGQTLSISRNYERLQQVWQPGSEHDPAELVGNMAAILQKRTEVDATFNFDGYSGSDWLIKPAFRQEDWPDHTDQNDAINDGMTPIASNRFGSYMVMYVTTRSKDSTGLLDDFRASEGHRPSGADSYTDTWLLRHALSYSGKKLKDDERLADGTVNVNQTLSPKVVTPSNYRPFMNRLINEFVVNETLQEGQASKDSLRIVIDPNNGGRLEMGHDLSVINLFHQVTFRLAETTPG